ASDPTRLPRLLGQLPPVAPSAAAATTGQPAVIPVAGSVPGAAGTFFRTDVSLLNGRNQNQDVLVAWLRQAQDGTDAPSFRVTLPSTIIDASGKTNVTPAISDFVGRLGLSGLGSLLVIGMDANGN